MPVSSRTLQGTADDPVTHVPGFEGVANLSVLFPPSVSSLVHRIPLKFVVPPMVVFAHGAQTNMAEPELPPRLNAWEDVHALLLGTGIPLIWSLFVSEMGAIDALFR